MTRFWNSSVLAVATLVASAHVSGQVQGADPGTIAYFHRDGWSAGWDIGTYDERADGQSHRQLSLHGLAHFVLAAAARRRSSDGDGTAWMDRN